MSSVNNKAIHWDMVEESGVEQGKCFGNDSGLGGNGSVSCDKTGVLQVNDTF